MNQREVKYKSLSLQLGNSRAFIRFAPVATQRSLQEKTQKETLCAPWQPFEAADQLAKAISRAFPIN